ISVFSRKKAIPTGFLCLNNSPQFAIGILMISDEINAAYSCKLSFVDLEYEIDSVFRELDYLGFHGCPKPSAPTVEIEDAFDIVLDPSARVNHAGAQLYFGAEVFLVELVVALKRYAVDDRIFDDFDDQSVADQAEVDIGEQPGGKQRFQRTVDAFLVPGITRLDLQIRANRLGFDALYPFNPNIGDCPTAHLSQGWAAFWGLRGGDSRQVNCGKNERTEQGAPRTTPTKTIQGAPTPRSTSVLWIASSSAEQTWETLDKLEEPAQAEVVPGREHHQSKHQGQTDAKAEFLGLPAERLATHSLGCVEQQMPAVKN